MLDVVASVVVDIVVLMVVESVMTTLGAIVLRKKNQYIFLINDLTTLPIAEADTIVKVTVRGPW